MTSNIFINKHKSLILPILMIMLLFLIPTFAHANVLNNIKDIFVPVKTDISLNILSQIFGDLIALASGESVSPYANQGLWLGTGLDPLQYVLKFFNMACLVIATLLGTFSLYVATANTAHEGVFLGKELNTPFYFLKTGVAVAFILPIFEGYCFLQLIIASVIIASVGIANTTWVAYFGVNDAEISSGWNFNGKTTGNATGSMNDLYSLKMPSPQVAEVAYKTFEGYTCVYGMASERLSADVNAALTTTKIDEKNDANNKYNETLKQSMSSFDSGSLYTFPSNTGYSLDGAINSGNIVIANGGGNFSPEQNINNEIKTQTDYMKNEKDVWEKVVKENANAKKLEFAAMNMFGIKKYNESDFPSNVKSEDLKNKVFVFGVPFNSNATSSNLASGNNGSLQSQTCGFIDFGSTNDVLSSKKLSSENENKTISKNYIKNNSNSTNKNQLANKKIDKKQSDDEKVLSAYIARYASLNKEIKSLAFQYVNEVNEKIRFNKNKGFENENNASVNEQIKAELLTKYNNKLEVIYENFEQNLISDLHNIYTENKKYTHKGSASIKDLPTNITADKGNYIDFIKVAKANAQTDGWFTGGMWYMSITNSISKLHELTSIQPYIKWASTKSTDYQNMVGILSTANVNNNTYANIVNNYGLYDTHALYSNIRSIAYKNNTDNQHNDLNAIASLAMGVNLTDMFDTGRHAVILMTEAGHDLINKSQEFIIASSYSQMKQSFRSNSNGSFNGIQDPSKNGIPSSQAQFALTMFIASVIAIGVMMAYYIPALPFLIWSLACLGWVVSVIEAVVIAPLWGAMHLTIDGNKYTGRGSTGYALLMSLALRPTLMVLGLIASIIVTQVFGAFMIYIYALGMNLSVNPESVNTSNITISKFIFILATYAIFAIYMSRLIIKMFNIIVTFPDNVSKWIGGPSSNLQEYANVATNETYGQFNSLGSGAGNAYANRLKEYGESSSKQGLSIESALGGFHKKQFDALNSGQKDISIPTNSSVATNVETSSRASVLSGSSIYNPPVGKGAGEPMTAGDNQRITSLNQNALKMASDSGMSSNQAALYAQQVASVGYKDIDAINTTNDWANNGVFSRGDQLVAQNALHDALNNANNGVEYIQNLSSHVSSVQASNNHHYQDLIDSSVQQGNTQRINNVNLDNLF